MGDIGRQAQHLAVWVIRTALRPDMPPFRFRSSGRPDQWQELAALHRSFCQAQAALIAAQGRGLEIAALGQLALTRDEMHLLIATAASQMDEATAREAALCALSAAAPLTMLTPVTALGAVLASHGYWLPEPPAAAPDGACRPEPPLPAPALGAVRHRTALWRQAEILWP